MRCSVHDPRPVPAAERAHGFGTLADSGRRRLALQAVTEVGLENGEVCQIDICVEGEIGSLTTRKHGDAGTRQAADEKAEIRPIHDTVAIQIAA
jgi:hypothetical protein